MRDTELSKKLRCLKTALKIVSMSGYLEFGDRSRDFQEGGFLQKPFSRDSLVAKLNEAFKATGIINRHELCSWHWTH